MQAHKGQECGRPTQTVSPPVTTLSFLALPRFIHVFLKAFKQTFAVSSLWTSACFLEIAVSSAGMPKSRLRPRVRGRASTSSRLTLRLQDQFCCRMAERTIMPPAHAIAMVSEDFAEARIGRKHVSFVSLRKVQGKAMRYIFKVCLTSIYPFCQLYSSE